MVINDNCQMEKTINGVKYYLPSNLTLEQKAIYVHIIDWKKRGSVSLSVSEASLP